MKYEELQEGMLFKERYIQAELLHTHIYRVKEKIRGSADMMMEIVHCSVGCRINHEFGCSLASLNTHLKRNLEILESDMAKALYEVK